MYNFYLKFFEIKNKNKYKQKFEKVNNNYKEKYYLWVIRNNKSQVRLNKN